MRRPAQSRPMTPHRGGAITTRRGDGPDRFGGLTSRTIPYRPSPAPSDAVGAGSGDGSPCASGQGHDRPSAAHTVRGPSPLSLIVIGVWSI